MSNTLNYLFNFQAKGDKNLQASIDKIDKKIGGAQKSASKFAQSFSKGLDKINKKLGGLQMNAMINNIQHAAQGLESMNSPAIKLDASLKDLQAITGVSDKKLQQLERSARKSAKTFGVDASQGVESYKLLLSQLTPELAKHPKVLKSMGDNVAILSKTMKNDQAAATSVLTTAMNQYGVSFNDPIAAQKEMSRMMNIMSAAAKEGSAELPQQKQALEQSGMAAKAASLAFEEHAAAIQVLDKAGKKGSEGGVALRNTLSILSTGRFLPKQLRDELKAAGVDISILGNKSLKFTDRLRPLKNILHDDALMTKMFGRENKNAALALINSIDRQDELTKAIVGTNTAREQANIVMESSAEKNARLKARIDDFKISMFNATGGAIGYANVLGQLAFDISNLIPIFSGVGKMIAFVTSAQKMQALWTGIVTVATKGWTAAQWLLNVAMSPIFLIPAIVIAIGAAIVWVVNKTEGWGKAWKKTIEGSKFLFKSFVSGIKLHFTTMVNGLMIGINKIKKGWYQFKVATGLGDASESKAMISKINADTEARKRKILDAAKDLKENTMKAVSSFKEAGGSIKLKVKPKVESATSASTGMLSGLLGGGSKKTTSGSEELKKTNTATATGGRRTKTVNIQLKSLIESLKIEGSSFKDSATQMEQQTVDALMRVLASAAAANN